MDSDLDKEYSREYSIENKEITTKESIVIEVPNLMQKVKITVTKKHFYDSNKKKMVTDQIIHRARYSLKNTTRKDN